MTMKLEEQISLAKSHGIYGFAFYYQCSFNPNNLNEPLELFLHNKNLKINFLLIIENNTSKIDKIIINISHVFDNIEKYIIDERYIKFYNRSVIGLNQEYFNTTDIIYLRKKFKEKKLTEIFILSKTNSFNHSKENNNLYNGLYCSPSTDSLEKIYFKLNKTFAYFYTHLLYFNLLACPLNKNYLFRVSVAMTKFPIYINESKTYIFGDYSPEKFYFLNKIIIDWTKRNHNKDNQYIFINNFNNLQNDSILGYANINAFSKALYGLPFILKNKENFNLLNLEKNVSVLIQAHIYYTDLLQEIINKTNNIPVPFDLYITTNTQQKKIYIENFLKENSIANKYEILITPNKGRDVIPFLIQLKDILMKYKYLCHIHTKKHGENEEFGKYWQHYLYENLLGNKIIITKILSDFENHKELGFIFPENFYVQIKYAYRYNYLNWHNIDNIFSILFPNLKIKAGKIIIFPVGNMFWTRTDAIYQIFNEKIIKLAPEEKGQIDNTILHAIERFWLYLVKLNGFYYKTILYYI